MGNIDVIAVLFVSQHFFWLSGSTTIIHQLRYEITKKYHESPILLLPTALTHGNLVEDKNIVKRDDYRENR